MVNLDLNNIGRTNQFRSREEADIIRGVVTQKKQILECIKREMTRLAGEEKSIEEDLVRFGVALSLPNLLPDDILRHMFILMARDYGPVHFPPSSAIGRLPGNHPPQLTISHVCSRWRRIALRTSELWSNTHLDYPKRIYTVCPRIYFHQRWISRARKFPVSLSLGFSELNGNEIVPALVEIILPVQVECLCLDLTYEKFTALSEIPEGDLAGLMGLKLELLIPTTSEVDVDKIPYHFVTRLQHLTFRRGDLATWLDRYSPIVPWSQLQSLKIYESVGGLHPIVGVLPQMPMLRVLALTVSEPFSDAVVPVTMASLQDIALYIEGEAIDSAEFNEILRTFTCPSITKFALNVRVFWTSETFKIIKEQYNMQLLEEVSLMGGFALPASSILQEAPMLCSLMLEGDGIIDDDAITGISDGTLGRFLRSLNLGYVAYDTGEVLDMVEARKKTVDRLIAKGCTWKEEITVLNHVELYGEQEGDKYEERIGTLKEAGILVLISE